MRPALTLTEATLTGKPIPPALPPGALQYARTIARLDPVGAFNRRAGKYGSGSDVTVGHGTVARVSARVVGSTPTRGIGRAFEQRIQVSR
jgi:hypothetical protein